MNKLLTHNEDRMKTQDSLPTTLQKMSPLEQSFEKKEHLLKEMVTFQS